MPTVMRSNTASVALGSINLSVLALHALLTALLPSGCGCFTPSELLHDHESCPFDAHRFTSSTCLMPGNSVLILPYALFNQLPIQIYVRENTFAPC